MRINILTQENELDINNQEQNKGKLTHFNEAGEAHMVDVHAKDDTYRVAKACGTIKVTVSYTHLWKRRQICVLCHRGRTGF